MRNDYLKTVESLQVSDFKINPVWEYVNDEHSSEMTISPVDQIPVELLDQKLVGTQVQLANGKSVWAYIGNVDAENPRSTEHFLTLSLEHNGQWFSLSRYHDLNYSEHGPNALAKFLGMSMDDVFPITYDITQFAKGHIDSLSGKILKEPREKLTREEIIALAVM